MVIINIIYQLYYIIYYNIMLYLNLTIFSRKHNIICISNEQKL